MDSPRRLIGRISRLEVLLAAGAAVVLAGLVVAEPAILEAPFENARTVTLTVGATVVAALVLLVLLHLRAPPVARVVVLGAPFVAVSWWLLSPYFVDEKVDDEFVTSIAEAGREPTSSTSTTTGQADAGPVLRGAGRFVGLAGHEGTGDAGFFALADGSHVLRLENFDIQNGPDLRLYVVPGADQTTPGDDSVYLGELRGNVGDQSYELPADVALAPGHWTVLVWCEAFTVEFVAANVSVT